MEINFFGKNNIPLKTTCEIGLKTVLVILTTFIFFLKPADSCKCAIKHPQLSYCTADFVLEGRTKYIIPNYVTEENATLAHPTGSLPSWTYFVQVKKIYKFQSSKAKKQIKQNTKIYTPGTLHQCGIFLQKDKKYILAGHIHQNQLRIDSCCWVQDSDTLTHQQRVGLKRVYLRNCRCQVKCCTGSQCSNTSRARRQNQCMMDTSMWSCYTRYGICTYVNKKGQKGCMWKKRSHMNRCLVKTKWKDY